MTSAIFLYPAFGRAMLHQLWPTDAESMIVKWRTSRGRVVYFLVAPKRREVIYCKSRQIGRRYFGDDRQRFRNQKLFPFLMGIVRKAARAGDCTTSYVNRSGIYEEWFLPPSDRHPAVSVTFLRSGSGTNDGGAVRAA